MVAISLARVTPPCPPRPQIVISIITAPPIRSWKSHFTSARGETVFPEATPALWGVAGQLAIYVPVPRVRGFSLLREMAGYLW